MFAHYIEQLHNPPPISNARTLKEAFTEQYHHNCCVSISIVMVS